MVAGVLKLFLNFKPAPAGSGLQKLDSSVLPSPIQSQKIMNKED